MEDVGEKTRATYSVPPVERALRVLRHIAAGHDCASIAAASSELGINRTTLLRILHTLQNERMIEPRVSGQGYRLGVGLIGLAAGAMSDRNVITVSRPRLSTLASDTGLSAHLAVLDGQEIVYLIREVPNAHLVSNIREGSRLPAHATTMGRILLAQLSEDKVRDLYSCTPMPEFTKVTATSIDDLLIQLAGDRQAGIVWSDGNFEPTIGSCACVVRNLTGAAVAAINLSGAASEFTRGTDRAEAIYDAIEGAATDISAGLGYIGDPKTASRADHIP